MAITKSQADYIDGIFENRRLENQIEMDRRRAEVYDAIPEIGELNDKAATLAADAARRSLSGDASAMEGLDKTLSDIAKQREALLLAGGYSADYLDDIYHCQICKDTGYVNGESCKCREEEISKMLYTNSQLSDILKKENFSTFNFDYYSDDVIDEATNMSALENIKNVVASSKEFINDFDKDHSNLLFYGMAGTGKTFLINCITKELLDQSYSVIYLPAIQFFELMANHTFGRENETAYNEVSSDDIMNCDLLVIDDLGTEVQNTFTDSCLFNCMNERLLHQKSTLISTNLSLEELFDTYNDRIFSRAIGEYRFFKIFGDDIRRKK